VSLFDARLYSLNFAQVLADSFSRRCVSRSNRSVSAAVAFSAACGRSRFLVSAKQPSTCATTPLHFSPAR
jgi:uncharacterized heparinase superfamily protein